MNWKRVGIVFALIVNLSCSRDGCPLSAGNTISENRDLPSFQEIVLYDKIDVIITPDSLQNVRVTAGKNLLSGISTSVTGGTLTIQDNNPCKLLRTDASSAQVFISTAQLQKISYSGAGYVRSTDTIRAPVFTIDCYDGSGSINLTMIADSVSTIIRTRNTDITLSGHGYYAYLYCAEEGDINLLQYKARAVSVVSKTLRDIEIHVTDSLYANVLYKGNVYYQGNPSLIQSTISNAGKLIHLP
jgi:hypothetical protein